MESSGISPAFAASIKISAFCSLANIPDIWRRAQTIHMTELFIALNTEKCTSGATTRARFCSLVNLQSNDFHTAVKIVQQKSLRRQYKANRMAQTIEYMKARKILLVSNKAGGGQPVQNLCDEIKEVLTKARMDKIYGFTDGSSRPREKVANSGLGIALYGSDKKLLWEAWEYELKATITLQNWRPQRFSSQVFHTKCTSLSSVTACQR